MILTGILIVVAFLIGLEMGWQVGWDWGRNERHKAIEKELG